MTAQEARDLAHSLKTRINSETLDSIISLIHHEALLGKLNLIFDLNRFENADMSFINTELLKKGYRVTVNKDSGMHIGWENS